MRVAHWTLFALLMLIACNKKSGKTTPTTPESNLTIDASLCDTDDKNVATFDFNRDGQPDVWRLVKVEDDGGTKVEWVTCKQVDFDHDGRKDWVVGYGRKGTRSFEKADMDWDGKFDLQTIFDPKTGKRGQVERDTNFDGKFDVTELYDATGQVTSIKHDSNSDGQVDEWEQYKEGLLVAILYDDDFDGQVDRRDEDPNARQKVKMPTETERGATDTFGGDGDKPNTSAAPGTAKPATK